MPQKAVELAEIKLKDGIGIEDLMAASQRLQVEFLDMMKGFIKRELLQLNEREYADLVYWESQEDAQAAFNLFTGSPACLEFLALMEFDESDPAAGVSLYRSIESYGTV